MPKGRQILSLLRIPFRHVRISEARLAQARAMRYAQNYGAVEIV
jgi:hypothetical protein